MAQYKRYILLTAEISDPIPGEDAFYGNNDVFTKWGDSLKEDVRVCLDVPVQDEFALPIEDTKNRKKPRETLKQVLAHNGIAQSLVYNKDKRRHYGTQTCGNYREGGRRIRGSVS